MNLTKDMKDLYTENQKTLMKEIEEDTNKWKDIPCLWMRRINIVKMFRLPKSICRYNAISIKISMSCFIEIGKTVLKFVLNHKRPKIVKAILRKKEQSITLPDFRLYHTNIYKIRTYCIAQGTLLSTL